MAASPLPKFLRILLTGSAFLAFNLGSALLSWVLVPRAKRRIDKLPPEDRRAAWTDFYLATNRWIVQYMRRARLYSYTPPALPEDLPRDQGYVIVSNHPSLIDILIIKATVPGATSIVRYDLFHAPHLKNLLVHGNDFSGPKDTGGNLGETTVLDTFVERLDMGFAVVVFPEGTRSKRYRLNRFRRGAVEAAIRAKVPIVPLFISFHPPTLMHGQKWWEVPDRMIEINVEFLPILQTTPDTDAHEVTRFLKAAYDERLHRDILERGEPEERALLSADGGRAAGHLG
jgi:1-acyl-sn-glycerol-3-phosphate acyltransferase